MGLLLREANSLNPVTLETVKAYLRLDVDLEDSLLQGMIASATDIVERYLGLSLLEKVWIWTEKPDISGVIEVNLPMGPLIHIESVLKLTSSGERIPLRRYRVDQSCLLKPVFVCQSYVPVEVTYRCGFGATPKDIPSPISQAILILVSNFYENRQGDCQIPKVVRDLLQPYRTTMFHTLKTQKTSMKKEMI